MAAAAVAAPPPLPPESGGATLSSFRASRNRRLPLWAQYLRSETDPNVSADKNEFPELKSLSHEGRVRFHARQFVPQGNTVLKHVPLKLENEEQLLYVALYRDKIADQQAAIESQKAKDAGRGRADRRQRSQAQVPATAELSSSFEGDGSLECAGLEAASSASVHEASQADIPAGPQLSGLSRDASLPPLSERRGRWMRPSDASMVEATTAATSSGHGPRTATQHGSEQEGKKSTHIASVSSALGAGGVAAEYMEAKRLGKLFDEWKSQQEDEDEVCRYVRPQVQVSPISHSDGLLLETPRHGKLGLLEISTPMSTPSAPTTSPRGDMVSKSSPKGMLSKISPRGAAAGKGRGRSSQQDPTADNGGTSSASSAGGRSRRSSAQTADPSEAHVEPKMEQPQPIIEVDDAMSDDGSFASGHRAVRASESKMVNRLYQVVTNPKAIREVVDRDGEGARRVPSYVEGFPTMNLMRLYRGPWRLEL